MEDVIFDMDSSSWPYAAMLEEYPKWNSSEQQRNAEKGPSTAKRGLATERGLRALHPFLLLTFACKSGLAGIRVS